MEEDDWLRLDFEDCFVWVRNRLKSSNFIGGFIRFLSLFFYPCSSQEVDTHPYSVNILFHVWCILLNFLSHMSIFPSFYEFVRSELIFLSKFL